LGILQQILRVSNLLLKLDTGVVGAYRSLPMNKELKSLIALRRTRLAETRNFEATTLLDHPAHQWRSASAVPVATY
jgi:hypothetical protein